MEVLQFYTPFISRLQSSLKPKGSVDGRLNNSRPVIRKNSLNFPRKSESVSCEMCNVNTDFSKPFYDVRMWKNSPTPRKVFVKSSVAGAEFPDAAYSMTGFQLGSSIKGICFYVVTSLIAIVLFVFMVAVHPFVLLFDRHRRKAHHLIAKIWAKLTLLPFFSVEFKGLENLPASDVPAVYVSNHQSFLDIFTVLTLGRNFKFISKTAIFLFPIIGWAMYFMGTIRLKRMDTRSQFDCLKRCMILVRKGASVFFFPEGTRSKDGKLGAFKKGAFSVAAKTGVPVVPITIIGTGCIMPPGKETRLNSGSIKIIIQEPILGSNADELCDKARNSIENALLSG